MKRLLFFMWIALLFPAFSDAQLPQRDHIYVLVYNTTNSSALEELFIYDPAQPVSATNPVPNTIIMPASCTGLAVSPVLGSTDTTLTFYTTVNGKFWYYDHNTGLWVNTGHSIGQSTAINICAGGGFIYAFQPFGSFPSVARYDGTSGATSVAGGMAFPFPFDIIADCSGNFYVMGGVQGFFGIRKYSSAGTQLQGYTVNNPGNLVGSGGMANIGPDIYTDNLNALNFIHSTVVSATTANVVGVTSPMPYLVAGHRVDDMASVAGSLLDSLPSILIATNDTIICTGSLANFSSQVTNSGGNGAYQWYVNGTAQPGASTDTFNYQPANGDTVTLHYTAGGSCGNITATSAGKVIHVQSVLPPVVSVRDTLICTPGPVTLSVQVGSPGNLSFKWSPASAIISVTNMQSVIANGSASTNFIVTVTDSINAMCKASVSDTIHLKVSDVSGFNAFGATSICSHDSAQLHARGGISYVWTPSDHLIYRTDSDVVVRPSITTTYQVAISDVNGCTAQFPLPVKVGLPIIVNAGPDHYIKQGESVQLKAQGGQHYHWYPNNHLSSDNNAQITATPEVTTKYYVTVVSDIGCTATDSVSVYVSNTIIPNAFTPNGDGLNDRIIVRFIDPSAILLNFSIYDRWGNNVFYTNNAKSGWDGTYKGNQAEMGTYFYLLYYAEGNKSFTDKGNISLIR